MTYLQLQVSRMIQALTARADPFKAACRASSSHQNKTDSGKAQVEHRRPEPCSQQRCDLSLLGCSASSYESSWAHLRWINVPQSFQKTSHSWLGKMWCGRPKTGFLHMHRSYTPFGSSSKSEKQQHNVRYVPGLLSSSVSLNHLVSLPGLVPLRVSKHLWVCLSMLVHSCADTVTVSRWVCSHVLLLVFPLLKPWTTLSECESPLWRDAMCHLGDTRRRTRQTLAVHLAQVHTHTSF